MQILPMSFSSRSRHRRSSAKRELFVLALLFPALAVLSCQDKSGTNPQGRPAAERTSVHYMMPAVQAAHEGVLEADKLLRDDPPDVDAARKALEKATWNLANLEWFYVPATEARENVYNAYLEHLAGHTEERDLYLDAAKNGLLHITERSSSYVEPYIMDLTDRIETVQRLIRDGIPADEALKSLCEFFQLHLVKAQLVIDEHAFDKQQTGY